MPHRIDYSVIAAKLGADAERVAVWDAMSELFLDTEILVEDLNSLAEIVADSPFSFAELGHIVFREVGPVCCHNSFLWVGGEGMGFNTEWLVEKCLANQKKYPYRPGSSEDKLPVWFHLVAPLYLDAYSLVYQTQRVRDSRRIKS